MSTQGAADPPAINIKNRKRIFILSKLLAALKISKYLKGIRMSKCTRIIIEEHRIGDTEFNAKELNAKLLPCIFDCFVFLLSNFTLSEQTD